MGRRITWGKKVVLLIKSVDGSLIQKKLSIEDDLIEKSCKLAILYSWWDKYNFEFFSKYGRWPLLKMTSMGEDLN